MNRLLDILVKSRIAKSSRNNSAGFEVISSIVMISTGVLERAIGAVFWTAIFWLTENLSGATEATRR